MSLFSKILVGLLVAVIAYCLWPRSPSMAKFDPEKMAQREAEAWKALRDLNSLKVTGNFYRIYDLQHRFNPVRSLTMARDMTSALNGIFRSPEPGDQESFIPQLVQVYVIARRDSEAEFDASAVARLDFLVWARLTEEATAEQLEQLLIPFWNGLYGSQSGSYAPAAKARASALTAAFYPSPNEVDWLEVQTQLTDSWQKLREVVPEPEK